MDCSETSGNHAQTPSCSERIIHPATCAWERDLVMRTDLVTIRFSRRRNLDFINLIRPIPVKGWFVNEV